jgi:hypothetical protein
MPLFLGRFLFFLEKKTPFRSFSKMLYKITPSFVYLQERRMA